jgi:hypothetical protein
MLVSEELNKYLSDPDLANNTPFSANELSEAILTVYNLLKWSLQDQCDLIVISSTRIVWKKSTKKDIQIGHFDVPINFAPIFKTVIDRDLIIKRHLQQIDMENNGIHYLINLNSEID